MKYKCLSIAGFDGSGGAGIQADLKTFSALGCYGMTVLTALPIQNTCGVKKCYKIPLLAIKEQLEFIFNDILPNSIKIGMLFSEQIIKLIANFLEKNAKNIPVVLDPVMIAKSGDPLLLPNAIHSLKEKLIPLSTIITPNLPESYMLVKNEKNIESLAKELLKLGSKAVLIKGGHNKNNDSNDLFLDQAGKKYWLTSKRIISKNTHGTGCTLSASICSFLAHDLPLLEACKYSKKYISGAILASKKSIGKGYGPLNHFYHIWPTINKIMEN